MFDTHAIVMVDATGVIRVWSAGAEALFGYDAPRAIGQTLDLIVPEDRREQHWAGFRAAMRTGKTKLDQPAANLPIVCGDGRTVRFASRLVLLRNARGEAVGALGIFAPNRGSQEGDPGLPSL